MFRALWLLVRAFLFLFVGMYALIVAHEFGHFIPARTMGVGVVEYSVGSGPQLWSGYVGETKFTFNLWPTGGFNRPAHSKTLGDFDAGQLKYLEEHQPAAFAMLKDRTRWIENVPAGNQFFIFAGGLIVQAIAALLILIAVFVCPRYVIPPGVTVVRLMSEAMCGWRSVLWILFMMNVFLLTDNLAPWPGMDGFIMLLSAAEHLNGPLTNQEVEALVQEAFLWYALLRLALFMVIFLSTRWIISPRRRWVEVPPEQPDPAQKGDQSA